MRVISAGSAFSIRQATTAACISNLGIVKALSSIGARCKLFIIMEHLSSFPSKYFKMSLLHKQKWMHPQRYEAVLQWHLLIRATWWFERCPKNVNFHSTTQTSVLNLLVCRCLSQCSVSGGSELQDLVKGWKGQRWNLCNSKFLVPLTERPQLLL